jgi:hypothetical protein
MIVKHLTLDLGETFVLFQNVKVKTADTGKVSYK